MGHQESNKSNDKLSVRQCFEELQNNQIGSICGFSGVSAFYVTYTSVCGFSLLENGKLRYKTDDIDDIIKEYQRRSKGYPVH